MGSPEGRVGPETAALVGILASQPTLEDGYYPGKGVWDSVYTKDIGERPWHTALREVYPTTLRPGQEALLVCPATPLRVLRAGFPHSLRLQLHSPGLQARPEGSTQLSHQILQARRG